MKKGIAACLGIAVIWAVLAILQLWFHIMNSDTFFKVSMTAGILLIIIFLVTFVIREYLSEKELREKGYLD